MTAGQNGSSNGGGRPLWVAGLSPPDSWRSLRQPGNPQLHQVRHPQHRVWGHESKPEVCNFRLAKVSSFRLGLTPFPLHRLDRAPHVIWVMVSIDAFQHVEAQAEKSGGVPPVGAVLHRPSDRRVA